MTRGGQIFQASYYAGNYSGAATDGYHMTQWGSQYWAAQGKDHQWIAELLLPGGAVRRRGRRQRRGRPPRARRRRPGRGPDAPKGAAKLDVIGPVQLSPGPYRQGQTLKANFTLRNDGARTGTWAIGHAGRARAGQPGTRPGLGHQRHPQAGRLPAVHRQRQARPRGPLARLADRRRRRHAGAARRRGAVRVQGGRAGGLGQRRRSGERRRSGAGPALGRAVAGPARPRRRSRRSPSRPPSSVVRAGVRRPPALPPASARWAAPGGGA